MAQVGTKIIIVDGQEVTVRVFAPKARRSRNEDTQAADRMADVRYQTTPEDLEEFFSR